MDVSREMTNKEDGTRPAGRTRRNRVFAAEKETKVISDIRHGSASPSQKQAWRKFWGKIIVEVKYVH